ncbi:hypothetical protein KTC96_23280 (plasmid) [Clostridium estertheticum]|uniref:hypothetical protein n=1 Tax=Clostridium estertheticum TaxID=238834 RepID=UPI001C7CE924|nr:hypothetical protein [Clostridium estertheticum]MBX4262784.1 hypothetical protein [Clostridium estertheticum]WLC72818.1 hypothetical protein KTC96_23280 [Clostridium estertheticum]
MLKKFKQITRLVIFTLPIVFICSSCATEEMTSKKPNAVNAAASSIKSTSNSKNYKATLATNLKVDATVDASDVKNIPTLQVTGKVFDKNKLLNMFFGSKAIKEKEEGGQSSFTVNNKNLRIPEEPGSFNFITPLGDYITSIVNEEGEVNKFKLKELDFMTKSKATKQVTDMLKTIDITPHISPKIYALDYNTLQKEQDVLMKDKTYKEFVDLGKTKIKDKWTKDDECYYMVFKIDMNGILCYDSHYEMQSLDSMVSGSEVMVIISKNGIESFNINGLIYNQKKSKVNTSPLISMQQAVESLKKKYSNVILTDEMMVTDISMVYLPVITSVGTTSNAGVSSNRQIEMVPCWYFNINATVNMQGMVENMPIEVRINAITGKEIL